MVFEEFPRINNLHGQALLGKIVNYKDRDEQSHQVEPPTDVDWQCELVCFFYVDFQQVCCCWFEPSLEHMVYVVIKLPDDQKASEVGHHLGWIR